MIFEKEVEKRELLKMENESQRFLSSVNVWEFYH